MIAKKLAIAKKKEEGVGARLQRPPLNPPLVTADENRVAELMKKYFINITKNVNLKAPIINTTNDIRS